MIKDGINVTEDGITSFLMIGQSNMAGRGDFTDVEEIKNKSCYMLRMGRWQQMAEPINPDRPIFKPSFHSGTCLAASFADSLANHTGRKIGLIPCADGGTRIAQWMPGEVLFDHAVMMTKLALRSSTLGGFLWHQGESDCRPESFPLYKERFMTMAKAFREELDAESVPFLIGELSENIAEKWERGDYPKRMNELFYEIAEELPNCAVVPARELPLMPDGIHFTSPSLRTLGNRYFEAYLDLVKGDRA